MGAAEQVVDSRPPTGYRAAGYKDFGQHGRATHTACGGASSQVRRPRWFRVRKTLLVRSLDADRRSRTSPGHAHLRLSSLGYQPDGDRLHVSSVSTRPADQRLFMPWRSDQRSVVQSPQVIAVVHPR